MSESKEKAERARKVFESNLHIFLRNNGVLGSRSATYIKIECRPGSGTVVTTDEPGNSKTLYFGEQYVI